MKAYRKYVLIFIVCLVTTKASAADVPLIVNVKANTGSDDRILSEQDLKSMEPGVELKLLMISGAPSKDIIVEQRFETSVTVQNEGPHLDFENWKHGYTNWVALQAEVGGFAILPTPTENLPFPNVSQKEIMDYFAIYKKKITDLNHWSAVVSKCVSATTSPCAVGVNKVEFQIRRKNDNSSKVIRKIEIPLPMGC